MARLLDVEADNGRTSLVRIEAYDYTADPNGRRYLMWGVRCRCHYAETVRTRTQAMHLWGIHIAECTDRRAA